MTKPLLGLGCALALASSAASFSPAAPAAADGRVSCLADFLARRGSVLTPHAALFVGLADRYRLDWRLLPAIAIVETGGYATRRNNPFGWRSGRARFRSIEHAIAFVATRFAEAPHYRGRSALEILRVYNAARRQYPDRVLRVMRQIGESPRLPELPPSLALRLAAPLPH